MGGRTTLESVITHMLDDAVSHIHNCPGAEGEEGGAKDGDRLGGLSSRAERVHGTAHVAVRRQGPLAASALHVTSPKIYVKRARASLVCVQDAAK